jgi:hypothetical protein
VPPLEPSKKRPCQETKPSGCPEAGSGSMAGKHDETGLWEPPPSEEEAVPSAPDGKLCSKMAKAPLPLCVYRRTDVVYLQAPQFKASPLRRCGEWMR